MFRFHGTFSWKRMFLNVRSTLTAILIQSKNRLLSWSQIVHLASNMERSLQLPRRSLCKNARNHAFCIRGLCFVGYGSRRSSIARKEVFEIILLAAERRLGQRFLLLGAHPFSKNLTAIWRCREYIRFKLKSHEPETSAKYAYVRASQISSLLIPIFTIGGREQLIKWMFFWYGELRNLNSAMYQTNICAHLPPPRGICFVVGKQTWTL